MTQRSPPDLQALLKRSLIQLQAAQSRLDEADRRAHEPIAIIAIGCRFPGDITTPTDYQRHLLAGTDTVTELPAERWPIEDFYDPDPDHPGTTYCRHGSFLTNIDRFEPRCFGISPREAAGMDPQQRLLLEVAWEAIERSGRAPTALHGSRTGVFIGVMGQDYTQLATRTPAQIDAHTGAGNSLSVAAGRLSHCFGLVGPSLALDTACSSSLVAVHLAIRALRSGEAELALVGGVNLALSPVATLIESRSRMLAASGRCRTFDDAADGIVRGEGCALLLLRRLSRALADGDPIVAVLRGSAINHDGRTSGLTVPSGPAQERVLREALADAGAEPAAVGYVEAHGTGTPLGDPIELEALAAVYAGATPRPHPLRVGSVKTNFGHLEGAAGVAGLIKAALCVSAGELAPHLHLRTPSRRVDWHALGLTVPTAREPWPADQPRLAAVSSFGFSGTNAHVIVEAPPARAPASDPRPVQLLTLSARTPAALVELARMLAARLLELGDADFADACHTARVGRSDFEHRLALLAPDATIAAASLRRYAAGERDHLIHGRRPAVAPALAFAFAGQGAHHPGMGRELAAREPVFAAELRRDLELAQPGLTRPLAEVIDADDGALDETEHTQPALVALELALVHLLADLGVRPAATLGYSVGEYAAAITADVLTPADGLRLVTARGLGMRDLPERGGMLAIHAHAAAVELLLHRHPRLTIAGRNGPRSTVVSGPTTALAALTAELTDGPTCKPLPVSHAFHSPLMEPMRAAFERTLAAVPLSRPRIAFISTLTGREVDEAAATPDHWSRQIVAPVRFADAVLALRARGLELVVEVGPRPTLQQLGRQLVDDAALRWLPTLDPRDPQALHRTLAELWVRGVAVDWHAYDRGRGHRRLELPTHPFARERCWLDGPPPWRPAPPRAAPQLLGERLESPALPATTTVFAATWTLADSPWLADHRVHGIVVAPAAAFMALAIDAGARVLGTRALRLDAAAIHQPLAPSDERPTHVQTILERTDAGLRCRVLGRSGDEWTLHFECTIAATPTPTLSAPPDGGEPLPVADLYAAFSAQGVEHGPALRVLERLRRGPDWTLATAAIDLSKPGGPAIAIDACLQSAAALASGTDTHIPVGVDAIAVYGPLPARLTIHARRRDAASDGAPRSSTDATSDHADTPARGGDIPRSSRDTTSDRDTTAARGDAASGDIPRPPRHTTSDRDAATRSDIDVYDESGRLCASFTGLTVRRAAAGSLQRTLTGDTRAWTYRRTWRPAPRGAAPLPARWLIFADADDVGARLAAALTARGCTCTLIRRADPDAPDPHRPETFAALASADIDAVAWLWGLDDEPTPDAAGLARARAHGCLGLVHLLRSLDRPAPPRLIVVTSGAVAIDAADAPPRLHQAALWGLAQGIASERPEFRCLRIDLPPRDATDDLLTSLTLEDGEDQIAVRHQLHVPRLERAALRPAATPPTIRPDGTYVIAGGLGGLGLALADWLVTLGARRLVLLARREPTPDVRARLDALLAVGAELHLAQVDLAAHAEVAALFAELRAHPSPVRGILHAAGQLHDAALTHQSAASLDAAARAKVEGAWNLHACAPGGLDFFVAFSSVAALLGTPGQANYAAANAALGALAALRRAQALPALTIEWGSFAGAGMAARLDARTTTTATPADIAQTSTAAIARRTLGLTPMPIAAGLRALEQLLTAPGLPPTLAVFAVDWRQLGRALPSAAHQRIFSGFLEPPPPLEPRPTDLRERLAAAPLRRRHELLQTIVADEVAAVLGIREPIAPRDRLFDLGVDSLLALEIRARLGHRLGHPLRATLVFDFPTIDDLTRHAAQELDLSLVEPAAAAEDAMTAELRALSEAQLTDLIDRELDSLLRGDP